jgi:hypothetical protein
MAGWTLKWHSYQSFITPDEVEKQKVEQNRDPLLLLNISCNKIFFAFKLAMLGGQLLKFFGNFEYRGMVWLSLIRGFFILKINVSPDCYVWVSFLSYKWHRHFKVT